MPQHTTEEIAGPTLRVADVGKQVPRTAGVPPAWRDRPARPSARRSDEARERRHREREIASWLRSLSR